MLKIAMLSKWHVHAEGYGNDIKNSGKAIITVVWDDNEARGKAWADTLGCDYSNDLDAVLNRDDVDAIVCDAPTTAHKEILIKAAHAKKHIFTEKALAPTVCECEEIKKAVVESGMKFLISFPQRTLPAILLAKDMIKNGDFGKVSLARFRDAHNGLSANWLPDYWLDEKDAAGGALMDLGCHPLYLSEYLFGKAKRISSIMTSPFSSAVDEHATVTMEFEDGVVTTAETSLISYHSPQSIEIFGSDATLLAYGNDIKIKTKETAKFTDDYITPKLKPRATMPLIEFIEACVNDTEIPAEFSIDEGIELTRMLENAYKSNKTGTIIEL